MSPKKKPSAPVARETREPAADAGPKTRLWPSIGVARHVAVTFVLGAVVLFTYCNTLWNTGFALDNKFIILEDPRLRNVNPYNLNLIFTQDYWWPKAVSGLYRPLTTLSYLFNYSILGNGAHAAGYHWINFILHWANTVLVYFVVLALIERPWPAFFAGALFGAHPIETESVANIVGRADLFATMWVLIGFLCYMKSAAVERKTEDAEAKPLIVTGAISALLVAFVVTSWKHPDLLPASIQTGSAIAMALIALGVSTVALACYTGGWKKLLPLSILMLTTSISVFCKESGVVVFGIVMLYDFLYRLRRKHPNWVVNLISNYWDFTLTGYVVLAAPILAMSYVRSQVFGQLRPPELPWVDNPLVMPGVTFLQARLTAIKVIGNYFGLLLWPQRLCCDYSYNQIPIVNTHFTTWEDWKAILALIAIVIVIVVAIRSYHRNKPVFFFVFFFFGTLLPSSNLIPNPTFGQSLLDPASWCIGSIMAERFLYLPSIGFVGCLVLAVYAICRRIILHFDLSPWAQRIWLQVVARTTLCLIVVAYGARAFNRNDDWKDDETLWTKAVETCPNSFKTHKSLAFALYEKDPEGKNIDRIIEEGEKARQVTDKTQIVLLHLGAYYRIKGDNYAQHGADGSLITTPQSTPWYQKSVEALEKAVPLDEAFNADNRRKELARGRNPDEIPDIGNHEIYWNLGISCMRLGEYQKALDAYFHMRHLAATNPDSYLSIASVYLATGHAQEGAVTLLEALLLDPNRTQALRLLTEIYRQIDKEGCALITNGGGEPRLNLNCTIVHNHICSAYYGLMQAFLETKDVDLHRKAAEAADNAVHNYNCPPDIFKKLLADKPTTVSSTQ